MNKKLSRLLEPGVALYFVALLLFAGVAVAVANMWWPPWSWR